MSPGTSGPGIPKSLQKVSGTVREVSGQSPESVQESVFGLCPRLFGGSGAEALGNVFGTFAAFRAWRGCKDQESPMGALKWGLKATLFNLCTIVTLQLCTFVAFCKGNFRRKMMILVGYRGQVWTSTLSPHLQSPLLDFPERGGLVPKAWQEALQFGGRRCEGFIRHRPP